MLTTKQRSIALYSLVVLFLVGAVWILAAYFMAATLTIVTNDASNTIVVQENNPHPHPINIHQNGTRVTVRVEAGTYTLTAKSTSTSSMQVVKLGIGEHKTITLNPGTVTSSTSNIVPVTTLGAGSFVASSDQLTFIDRNDPNYPLYSVNKTNRVSIVDNSRSYRNIGWADPSFGIGLVMKDTVNYGLVKIDNQNVRSISLPFSYTQYVSYAVAPDRSWYVTDGHTIFHANADGSFTKIYSSKDIIRLGVASNQAIQMSQQPVGAPRPTSVAVLHTDGTKYQVAGELYEAAWSPSGKKLVTSGDQTNIYDDQLNIIGTMPNSNVISPVWLDDSTLLYVLGGSVWSYNTTTGTVNRVVSIDPSVGNFSTLAISSDHHYVYVAVDRKGFSTITFDLYRFSIDNRPPADNPTISQRLLMLLPSVNAFCTENFMNFTTMTVLVQRNTAHHDCIDATRDSIVESKALDRQTVNRLNFQYIK